MQLSKAWRAVAQWVPFASRTIAYGTVSLVLGPLTKEHAASLWAMRRWSRESARGLDIDVQAEGLENVPAPPFVYCTNHQSIVDITDPSKPRYVKFIPFETQDKKIITSQVTLHGNLMLTSLNSFEPQAKPLPAKGAEGNCAVASPCSTTMPRICRACSAQASG